MKYKRMEQALTELNNRTNDEYHHWTWHYEYSQQYLKEFDQQVKRAIIKEMARRIVNNGGLHNTYGVNPSYYYQNQEVERINQDEEVNIRELTSEYRSDLCMIYWDDFDMSSYWEEQKLLWKDQDLLKGDFDGELKINPGVRKRLYYSNDRPITGQEYGQMMKQIKTTKDYQTSLKLQNEYKLKTKNIWTRKYERYSQDIMSNQDWDKWLEMEGVYLVDEVNGFDIETLLNLQQNIDQAWDKWGGENAFDDECVMARFNEIFESNPTYAWTILLPKIRKIWNKKYRKMSTKVEMTYNLLIDLDLEDEE